jgi:hypothetical protein
MDPALMSPPRVPVDQPILESLVIPPAMVVIDELLEGPSKVARAEGHHPIEALERDRPHEPLGVGVRIGRLKRRVHHVRAGIAQHLSHLPAPLVVTITHQHAMGAQQAVRTVRVRLTCRMNRPLGCGVDPTLWTRRDARSITNTAWYVTNPRHVQTSVVKKSAAATAFQCARRNVCHDVGRAGTGDTPCVLSIRAIVERPTRCPTFVRAPWIRV